MDVEGTSMACFSAVSLSRLLVDLQQHCDVVLLQFPRQLVHKLRPQPRKGHHILWLLGQPKLVKLDKQVTYGSKGT